MEQKIQHLGIIMDGNRRWARARGLAPFKGHLAGYKKVKEVAEWCRQNGIKILTLYAFSTENWKRPRKEVNYLMQLFNFMLTKDIKNLCKNKIQLNIVGRRDGFSKKLQKAIQKAEASTKDYADFTLNLAINYGGRQEIVDAVNKIFKQPPEEITEDLISKNIYTTGQPDPDLIVRTSGEQRLSGFLTWQSVYSELFFTKSHWPEFSKNDFDQVLVEFAARQRRYGK